MIEFVKDVKVKTEFSIMPTDFVENYLADAYDEHRGKNYNVVLCPSDSDDIIRIPMKYFYAENEYSTHCLMEEKQLLINGLRKYIEYEFNGYIVTFCGHELFVKKHCGFLVKNENNSILHFISGTPVFDHQTGCWFPEKTSMITNLGRFDNNIKPELSLMEIK